MALAEKLDQVVMRHENLAEEMSRGDVPPNEFAKLSKEYSDLTPVVEKAKEFNSLMDELDGANELLADPDTDAEMREMAEEEVREIQEKLPDLTETIQKLLLPKDVADSKNAILEVRAGTGGDEASLFAAVLFRMYEQYARQKGWKFEVMSSNETGLGGLKEGMATVTGNGAFARMKFESGVHRVQRVPTTESGGRIHTSAATVAVLPEAEDFDVELEEKDLRIDTYRAQGPGGQSVNTTDSAVRITHVPTGVVVQCQDEKSQHKNKAKAMKVLRSRIYEAERQRQADERASDRKTQVGSGDRSERIRTYNYPQSRVTDHRINLTLHKLDRIVEGEGLDEVIDALIAEDQAARLAAAS
ncbi:MAG TPA: peptide chain release factor 1 [Rhodospirillaceae bacterium]|nr:peptide chain release factor 1 [Rhodospirillaceae bacterium]HAT35827.1 peptide chain release factor 1 [Rhodospirillaceae bacterium]|tara:strand:- start:653 stop:1726 length:1074 start_codon:yes stop_codon:yes gene_type:complete